MHFPEKLVTVALTLALTTSVFAVPPANDKFAKAQVLPGVAGTITDATNVDATVERGEFSSGDEKTIWYKFTPPADGILQVEWDYTNSQLAQVDGAVLIGTTLKTQSQLDGKNYFSATGDRSGYTYEVKKAIAYRIRFDSYGGPPGVFSFAYKFVSGGGFVVVDPPRKTLLSNGEGKYIFESSEWLFNEGTSPGNVTVARLGSTEGPATVDWEIGSGSTEPGDFTGATSGTLSFAAGESRQTVALEFGDDGTPEVTKNFSFQLKNPTGSAVLLTPLTDMYLEDDDGAVSNDHFANATILAGSSGSGTTEAGTATVEANEPRAHRQSVWYQWTAPADGEFSFTAFNPGGFPSTRPEVAAYTGATLTALQPVQPLGAPGAVTGKNPRFAVQKDQVYHLAVLDESAGGTELTYQFSTRSIFRFTELKYDVLEGSSPLFPVINVGQSALASTVNFNTLVPDDTEDDSDDTKPAKVGAGEDFLAAAGQLVFAIGDKTKSFNVTVNADTKKEPIEFFDIAISTDVPDDSNDPVVDSGRDVARVFIVDSKTRLARLDRYFGGDYLSTFAAQTGAPIDGSVRLTFLKGRQFTGSLLLNGRKLSFKNQFPAAQTLNDVATSKLTFTIPAKSTSPAVDLEFLLTIFPEGGSRLTGKLVTGGSEAALEFGEVDKFFSSIYPLSFAGLYTLSITPDATAPAAVRAPGIATLTVKATGSFTLVGKLPDGTRLSGGGQVIASPFTTAAGNFPESFPHRLPISIPLYSGAGALTGHLQPSVITDLTAPAEGDGTGDLRWTHPVLAKGFIKTAFRVPAQVFLSRYPLAKGDNALRGAVPLATGLTFTHPTLTGSPLISLPLQVKKGNGATATATDPLKPKLSIRGASGLFSGSFTTGGKAVPFDGVILRNKNHGTGYFQFDGQAGTVNLVVP